MKDSRVLNRREFTLEAALAVLAGSTITILGCGGYKSPSGPSGPTDVVGEISSNHGHSAIITGAEMNMGGGVDLNIQGSATHNHLVSVSATQIASLKGGGRVTTQSTTGDTNMHTHTVVFQGPAPGTGGYGT
jgi:hypothetical protein